MSAPELEFADLTDFILRITERIWEERHVEDIRQYYTADCRVAVSYTHLKLPTTPYV